MTVELAAIAKHAPVQEISDREFTDVSEALGSAGRGEVAGS
jgi:hypothetical protein